MYYYFGFEEYGYDDWEFFIDKDHWHTVAPGTKDDLRRVAKER
jgi:hypothetical protein